ncbi:hypothetical protein [Lacticaseibacillus porcinae]|uniref:hypothetical protein n=1 Tax=Lacticaseibacillus porcinae TaxID=1123687 RepID=UPI000F79B4EB|nr:hypothetical protein [Lacticaseibacillus porcinae]
MRVWKRINLILAGIVLMLSLIALAKLGYGWYAQKQVTPQKVVVGVPKVAQKTSSSTLRLSDFQFEYAVDFLKRPTLVVKYRLKNTGGESAWPQYVLDSNVVFAQQTNAGTTSVLAKTDVASGQLSFLMQNYQENADILLKAKESVTIVSTYRLESRNRPVSMMVGKDQRKTIKPWTLKQVKADE